jgi:hypothetical protein
VTRSVLRTNHYLRVALLLAVGLFLLASSGDSVLADSGPQIELDVSKAGPRSVESMTERGVLRDYSFAWTSLTEALETNSLAPLNGPFVGTAKGWFTQEVAKQRQNGLSSRYINQNHKVEAVFYAPEGDVMELHDTAEYQLQLLDGSKVIHDENVVIHYVVLMTPAADRWVVRQLQAVQGF